MYTSLQIVKTRFIKAAAMASVLGLLSLSSCKKEDKESAPAPPAPPATKTEMLTGKTWKLSAATINPAMNGQSDVYAMMKDCEKDNTMKFDNSNVVLDEGASKCDAMTPQSQSKTWSFSNQETQINISNYAYKLVELSSNKLVMSYEMSYMGTSYVITETFSGQ